MPTPRIGKLDVSSRPVGVMLRTLDIFRNRTNHNDYARGPQLLEHHAKTRFARSTGLGAGTVRELIHRFPAKVHEITAQGAKSIEKACFRRGPTSRQERVANGSIQTRIGLVEKPSRRGRRFAHEQDSHMRRTIATAQALSGRLSGASRRLRPFLHRSAGSFRQSLPGCL